LAIALYGGRAERFVLGLGGLDIQYDCPRADYRQEGRVALAGPGANLAACGLAALLARLVSAGPWQDGLYLFCGCNALLALFNLVPALPLDGGVYLRCLLLRRAELWRAERLSVWCSLAAGLALLAAGLALFFKTRGNITLLACALAILGRQSRNFFTPGRKSLIV
jgi:stage IV sporulation protein FB